MVRFSFDDCMDLFVYTNNDIIIRILLNEMRIIMSLLGLYLYYTWQSFLGSGQLTVTDTIGEIHNNNYVVNSHQYFWFSRTPLYTLELLVSWPV